MKKALLFLTLSVLLLNKTFAVNWLYIQDDTPKGSHVGIKFSPRSTLFPFGHKEKPAGHAHNVRFSVPLVFEGELGEGSILLTHAPSDAAVVAESGSYNDGHPFGRNMKFFNVKAKRDYLLTLTSGEDGVTHMELKEYSGSPITAHYLAVTSRDFKLDDVKGLCRELSTDSETHITMLIPPAALEKLKGAGAKDERKQ